MANTNYYYSGQGSLYAAKRDPATGKPLGFTRIGNVPALSIDIEVDKFEHKEAESGNRSLDLTIVKEKKGKFTFTMESVTPDNLAMGLFGTAATVAAGTVAVGTPEIIKIPAGTKAGMRFPLANPNVSSVVVKDNAGAVTYDVNDDYMVDAKNGVIILGNNSTAGDIVTACASADINIKVSYSYGTYTNMDAFTSGVAPERYLRFEGLNTVDGSNVIVDMFRAQFDPLTGLQLINEEISAPEMKGAILADPFVSSGSQFFRQRIVV